MKTYVPKEGQIDKKWLIIDAEGKVFGHVAAEAAMILRGKHKPTFTPFLDCGDNVIILNVTKAKLTGNKPLDKKYYHHSGYMGGLKETNYADMMQKHPTRAMLFAIKGMLPHNRLGRKLAKNVRIYAGAEHQQVSQNPQTHTMSK